MLLLIFLALAEVVALEKRRKEHMRILLVLYSIFLCLRYKKPMSFRSAIPLLDQKVTYNSDLRHNARMTCMDCSTRSGITRILKSFPRRLARPRRGLVAQYGKLMSQNYKAGRCTTKYSDSHLEISVETLLSTAVKDPASP